ncbi:MAG: hypothetical protein BRD31_03270, partial [Bacteroidetes bacterium QH_2_64_26]
NIGKRKWEREVLEAAKEAGIPIRIGVNIIACPTCGRLVGDLFTVVEEVEEAVARQDFDKNLDVALMGCAVNGPGEAEGADLGVSLGRGRAHFFKHGEVVDTIPEDEIVDTVLEAIENWDEDEEPPGDGAAAEKDEADAAETTGVTKPDLPPS